MGFTTVTVTGKYEDATGASAAGSLIFTLTQGMANDGTTVAPSPIVATLDGTGSFSVDLLANDDTDTVPQGVRYGVTERITNAQPRDYYVTVSNTDSPIDISALVPDRPGWR